MVQHEHFTLKASGSYVELGCPAGVLRVPRQDISGCKLLAQVMSFTDESQEIVFTVPQGVLQTWILSSPMQSVKSSASLSPDDAAYDQRLPAFIQVRN